ncbi:hypothetical protein [Olivibacter ginsenosidimutans]
MKQRNITSFKQLGIGLLLVTLLWGACKRDEYYTDGGLANPHFEGTILQYLDSKPMQFDTIAEIVRLAGLEETFNNEEFTFFCPSDRDIKDLISDYRHDGVNKKLYELNRDTIKTLGDVDSLIWRKYLLRYMFRGRNVLADYPQIDPDLSNVYPGQNYYAYDNSISKIGVFYNDAVSSDGKSVLKYMGYRQLFIYYIPNLSYPDMTIENRVASSDIQPTNGVVHVLDYTRGSFGFDSGEVIDDIVQSKR